MWSQYDGQLNILSSHTVAIYDSHIVRIGDMVGNAYRDNNYEA